ncbi:CmpA/NrtA family ABC transporter substrate-binding protein [Chitinasiproducens palmae]|uniref:Nitrate/nitrite transport system substrate-binding protein n=1 Tax=Chitinasiproducens palmae TaxID=1770053 RepID=A0A1H2PQS6_9BURK|nr:CmpA/NrtA family ABC transporter substrate-binding protein [Chitinasiproducens palmae]SDV48778.1 nitrate/nitrite transport system substrate-binding protein [Chitinasiproducens palmae]
MTAPTLPAPTGASASPHAGAQRVRVGFVALSDAAPLVAAHRLQLDAHHGVEIVLCRQPSWSAVRDKLMSGELDAAHMPYGLPYGMELGIGGPQCGMAVLMVLNWNGQAITLAPGLADAYRASGELRGAMAGLGRKPVFAQTFPTGTHAMLLNYWLAAHGIDPLAEVRSIVIPPPQMAAALAARELDGFCAGEPWHAVAEAAGAGRTILPTSAIWPDHPEKVLACRRDFAALYPDIAGALIGTLLEACRWLDSAPNRLRAAQWLAAPTLLDAPRELIAARLLDRFPDGAIDGAAPLRFHADGAVNLPRAEDGLWFITQFRRWGMHPNRQGPDASETRAKQGGADAEDAATAARVTHAALYRDAAARAGVSLPADPGYRHVLCDGTVWHGQATSDYLAALSVRA